MTPVRELKKGSLGMLLLQLLRERPSYGYELSERLRTRSGGVLSFDEGAIYPCCISTSGADSFSAIGNVATSHSFLPDLQACREEWNAHGRDHAGATIVSPTVG
jgi:hypothetical protein